MGQVILDKAKAVLSHQRKIGGIRSAYHELLEAELLLVEAKSDVAHLKDRNSEIVQRLEEEKKSLNVLKVELEEKKRDAQRLFTEVKELSDEHRQDSIAEARDRTAEVISQEISAERAKLEVIQANNPQALEEYENWARRIEKEKADHDVQETRLADLTEKITTLRSQGEPRLDELVGQINDAFSYNFEQISCAGEVGVHKDEEFDKWAIEIKVKFRYVAHSPLLRIHTNFHVAAKARPFRGLINTGSRAVSGPCQRFFISCHCSRWRRRRSGWSMRSTRVWTPATRGWCTNEWLRLPAVSTRASIF